MVLMVGGFYGKRRRRRQINNTVIAVRRGHTDEGYAPVRRGATSSLLLSRITINNANCWFGDRVPYRRRDDAAETINFWRVTSTRRNANALPQTNICSASDCACVCVHMYGRCISHYYNIRKPRHREHFIIYFYIFPAVVVLGRFR